MRYNGRDRGIPDASKLTQRQGKGRKEAEVYVVESEDDDGEVS